MANRTKTREQPGNQTPNTPDVSESKLAEMRVADLREQARAHGISGVSSMKKDDLVGALVGALSRHRGGGPRQTREELEPKGDSRSLQYSQTIVSPDEDPERAGRSLVTRSHEVIEQWAKERNAVPATVEETWHGDRPGVLRFDFGGDDGDRLEHISWEQWFSSFDERNLNFIYQEERSDGRQSNFFRLDNPDREDG